MPGRSACIPGAIVVQDELCNVIFCLEGQLTRGFVVLYEFNTVRCCRGYGAASAKRLVLGNHQGIGFAGNQVFDTQGLIGKSSRDDVPLFMPVQYNSRGGIPRLVLAQKRKRGGAKCNQGGE